MVMVRFLAVKAIKRQLIAAGLKPTHIEMRREEHDPRSFLRSIRKTGADSPPGPRPIADRVVRLQMAAAAARLYPKVLAFWEEVFRGHRDLQWRSPADSGWRD
jgi:hypothetical protein